jgi:leucyl-tRNA synthetase
MRYPFDKIEAKWQKLWENENIHKTDLSDTEKKLYCLVMFIYPSGAKLHAGHWYNYGPTDSWARYKKLKGFNVFEPMGYDAFGLPAENYAIQTGIHPYDSTMKNIEDIRKQLKRIGCMYDWDAEIITCNPEYYKWNQWLFLQLYKKGLAVRKNAPVNWCPKDQTVLANEQVKDGVCERCGTVVIQKNLTQWFLRITEYADELLDGLQKINWPEKTKTQQQNWIGKSTGAEVRFSIEDSNEEIPVFTTRPDTLFGVTYLVLAPENPLVDKITTDENRDAVKNYFEKTRTLTEIERTSTVKEKTGIPIGAYAVNPVNKESVPVWVSDYVLASYGTGSVMAVPGHDERDFEFAMKFNLPIRKVILQEGTKAEDELTAAYTEPGVMINSGKYDGMDSEAGIEKIVADLESEGKGKKKINYKLRDWLVSRQRYWGTPIPIIHCPECGEIPVDEKDLPVELPYEVEFKPGGSSPLAANEKFMNVKCPKCNSDAKRDPDTMDTFVDSSWYYLRYMNPHLQDMAFDKVLAEKWTPVDMYVGGAEHTNGHLLYSRFIHKFFRDIGLLDSDEPFTRLIHQGTITKDGTKMSKRLGNIVNPDDFINKFGTDVFRMYLMFMGPYDMGGDWSDKGITGTERFVMRAFEMFSKYPGIMKSIKSKEKYPFSSLTPDEKSVYQKVNQTIAKFNEEIDHFRFNTSIASLMELINELSKSLDNCREEIVAYSLERFAVLLAPVAPHLAEECNSVIGNKDSLFAKPKWYEPDPAALVQDEVTIAVQVNGKLRLTIIVPANSTQQVVQEMIFSDERLQKYLDDKTIVKEIFVPNKIYNIVVK